MLAWGKTCLVLNKNNFKKKMWSTWKLLIINTSYSGKSYQMSTFTSHLYENGAVTWFSMTQLFTRDQIACNLKISNRKKLFQQTWSSNIVFTPHSIHLLCSSPNTIFAWNEMHAKLPNDLYNFQMDFSCKEKKPVTWDKVLFFLNWVKRIDVFSVGNSKNVIVLHTM